MLIETGGCSAMVSGELMNDLELAVKEKKKCKDMSELNFFARDSPISRCICHKVRHISLSFLTCY